MNIFEKTFQFSIITTSNQYSIYFICLVLATEQNLTYIKSKDNKNKRPKKRFLE